jgi:hypothetical protein
MIKKDMYFALTKHWILIIPLIVIVITISHQPTTEKPTVAFIGDFGTGVEEEIGQVLNIERVASVEEGMVMVEKSMVDAFVIKDEKTIIFRNERSTKSYYVRPILESVLYEKRIQIEYVGEEHVKRRDVFPLFFLFVFVAFGTTALLFQDDRKVINAILLSPVKNRDIVLSKVCVVVILLVLLDLFYLFYVDAVKLNLFLVVLVIGLDYAAIGTLLGIFYDNKYISSLVYPFMLLLTILPFFPNPVFAWIMEIVDVVLLTSDVPIVSLFALFAIFIGLLFLDLAVFDLKIRMKKVKG